MSSSPLSAEQMATGYARFLANHPDAGERIAALTEQDARQRGVTLDELRRTETARALIQMAMRRRMDAFEYLVGYAIESAQERERIIAASRDAQRRTINLHREQPE